MSTFWLHSTVDLFTGMSGLASPGGLAEINVRLRTTVQNFLQHWASWQDAKGTALWTMHPSQQGIIPSDCIVYFVSSYSHGVVRPRVQQALADPGLLPATRAQLTAADQMYAQQSMITGAIRHLGLTDATIPAVSEVWIGLITRMVRGLHAMNPVWTDAEIEGVGYALAACAYHEAMHNKVEPNAGAGFNLHGPLGGGGIARGISSQMIGSRQPPNSTHQSLMAQFFAVPRLQYIRPG